MKASVAGGCTEAYPSADRPLNRLQGVRQTGPGRWLVRCPAHDDRRASLSVREIDDGTLLIHCFAECGTADIVAAVGLELSALFPSQADARAVKGSTQRGPRIPPADALRAVSLEADLVAICAGRLAAASAFTESEPARLLKAAARIGAGAIEAGCYA